MRPSVTLLEHTPNPTRIMALAARLCYAQGQTVKGLLDGLTDSEAERLVRRVVESRHMSVLEHATFTFGVEGVSRNFSHQLVRHRNTSYEQQSLHFTCASEDFEMARPDNLPADAGNAWDTAREATWTAYQTAMAAGAPKEEARHILPTGMETRLVMTANLRQWLTFVQVRACVVNCREILVVAMKVKKLIEAKLPYLRDHLGPTCWTYGTCHEGKKFCGVPWKPVCLVSGYGVKPNVFVRQTTRSEESSNA